jgi:hypothetical protein
MTRGNQREIDRQRAANRHAGKGTVKTGDVNARREADAKALQEKVERKKQQEVSQENGNAQRGPGGAAKKKDGSKK